MQYVSSDCNTIACYASVIYACGSFCLVNDVVVELPASRSVQRWLIFGLLSLESVVRSANTLCSWSMKVGISNFASSRYYLGFCLFNRIMLIFVRLLMHVASIGGKTLQAFQGITVVVY